MKKLFIIASLFLGTLYVFANTQPVNAAGFDAGNIIDDSVFTDSGSMSVAQIQQFLVSKVPVCDTAGTQTSEYGGGTRSQWATAKYGQSTFTCLKDYNEGGISAAQIIYNAAQDYSISPKVLLVLLQKEQGLVTDTWPLNIQYRSATGYGCPDTAACDSQYYGLTNQIRWSAKMFHAIMIESPTWYTPYDVGNNFIRYSPDASCGGSNVFIQNKATQSLYNYTPYQPNAGALAAGMGTAPCGAYGNRNFHIYFTNWFGSTTGSPTYTWESAGQQVTISGTTTSTNTVNMSPGTTAELTVKAKNTSNQTWYRYNTLLGTARSFDRSSTFYNPSWVAKNRVAILAEESVSPGQVGTFKFTVSAPNHLTSSREYFDIVTEGKSWHSDIGYYYDVNVVQPTGEYYNATYLSSNLYSDPARTNDIGKSYNNVIEGSTLYGKISFKNIGNTPLLSGTTKLGTDNPRDRTSVLQDASWLNNTRLATIAESSVQPGQTGSILFTMKAPQQTGYYLETYGMVVEGKAWIDNEKVSFGVNIVSSPQSILSVNNKVGANNQLMSKDLTRRLVLQTDGNLVLYNNNNPVWASNTVGTRNPQLVLQSDGNLVLYGEGSRAVWNSGTVGNQNSLLMLQNDGNLVLYNENNNPRWWTNTYNR